MRAGAALQRAPLPPLRTLQLLPQLRAQLQPRQPLAQPPLQPLPLPLAQLQLPLPLPPQLLRP